MQKGMQRVTPSLGWHARRNQPCLPYQTSHTQRRLCPCPELCPRRERRRVAANALVIGLPPGVAARLESSPHIGALLDQEPGGRAKVVLVGRDEGEDRDGRLACHLGCAEQLGGILGDKLQGGRGLLLATCNA